MEKLRIDTGNKFYDTYLLYLGGTSVRQAMADTHLLYMEGLYDWGTGKAEVPPHIVVPAMDQANPDLNGLLALIEKDEKIMGQKMYVSIIPLCDQIRKIKEDMGNEQGMQFRDLGHAFLDEHLFLPPSVDGLELSHGYCSNQSAGAVAAPIAFRLAMEDPGPDGHGNALMKIVTQVINCTGSQAVHILICGPSGWGGEGRTHTQIVPEFLCRECVDRLTETGRMSRPQAEQHVKEHLLIDIIMHGCYFRFPALEKDKDVGKLTSEMLANFDPASESHINTFALIEHDLTCVQAEKPREFGNQYRHAHAAELVANDVARKCMQQRFEGKRCVIPHYSTAGPETNWSTLGVPEKTINMMISLVRFYAVLACFMKPQLGTCLDDINEERLYNTRIAALVYGEYGRKLKARKTRDDLMEELLIPFWQMYDRTGKAVRWIYEISMTGMDWESGDRTAAEQYTSLFNTAALERILSGDNPPKIDEFELDSLSECKGGNRAATHLTPDAVILNLNRHKAGQSVSFMEIMMEIYRTVKI